MSNNSNIPPAPLIPGSAIFSSVSTGKMKIQKEIANINTSTVVSELLNTTDLVVTGDAILGSVSINDTLDMNNNKIINLAEPELDSDAVNKEYIDTNISFLRWKEACRVATTENITLSGLQTIDGVLVASGERVLVKNQTDMTENGYYLASSGPWSRTLDMGIGDSASGFSCIVYEGLVNADTPFTCTNDKPNDIVGTSNLMFAELGGGIISLNNLVDSSQTLTNWL